MGTTTLYFYFFDELGIMNNRSLKKHFKIIYIYFLMESPDIVHDCVIKPMSVLTMEASFFIQTGVIKCTHNRLIFEFCFSGNQQSTN